MLAALENLPTDVAIRDKKFPNTAAQSEIEVAPKGDYENTPSATTTTSNTAAKMRCFTQSDYEED